MATKIVYMAANVTPHPDPIKNREGRIQQGDILFVGDEFADIGDKVIPPKFETLILPGSPAKWEYLLEPEYEDSDNRLPISAQGIEELTLYFFESDFRVSYRKHRYKVVSNAIVDKKKI